MPSGPFARVERWLRIAEIHKRDRAEVLRVDFFGYFEMREAERRSSREAREAQEAQEATARAARAPAMSNDPYNPDDPYAVDEHAEFLRLQEIAQSQTKRQRENNEYAAWEREHGAHAVAHRRICELSKRVRIPSGPRVLQCENCNSTPMEQFMEGACSREWYVCRGCNTLCERDYAPCLCED